MKKFVLWNQNLANVFYRLILIEAYGTGMRKIQHAYETQSKKPEIQTTGNAFRIILPNINASYTAEDADGSASEKVVNIDEQKILEYVQINGMITRIEAQTLLKVSASTATRLLRHLVLQGKLVQYGKTRGVKYTLTDQK